MIVWFIFLWRKASTSPRAVQLSIINSINSHECENACDQKIEASKQGTLRWCNIRMISKKVLYTFHLKQYLLIKAIKIIQNIQSRNISMALSHYCKWQDNLDAFCMIQKDAYFFLVLQLFKNNRYIFIRSEHCLFMMGWGIRARGQFLHGDWRLQVGIVSNTTSAEREWQRNAMRAQNRLQRGN